MKNIIIILIFGVSNHYSFAHKTKVDSTGLILRADIIEDTNIASRISPDFQLTISSRCQNIRVLKGIYMNYQNLDGIQATLLTPTGDTATVVFPEISVESLGEDKAKALTLQINTDSPLKISFDLNLNWANFQKNTEVYLGPYCGKYMIRFEFGWSSDNWKKIRTSGILNGWEDLLFKETVYSEWISFDVPQNLFESPTSDDPPIMIKQSSNQDFIQFIEKKEGMITREWLVDQATNYPLMLFHYDSPVDSPSQWESHALFSRTSTFQLHRLMLFSTSSSVSGTFSLYSVKNKTKNDLQKCEGTFVSGKIQGKVRVNYPARTQNQTRITGTFDKGLMDGEWVQTALFFSGHKLDSHDLARIHYRDGILNGCFQEFFPIDYGKGLRREVTYSNGKIDGTEKVFFDNGQVMSIHNYLPEYVITSIDQIGNILPQVHFSSISQVKDGEFLGYYQDGGLRYHYFFDKNKPQGECEFLLRYNGREYHTKGTFKDGTYDNGTFLIRSTESSSSPITPIQQQQYWIHWYKNGILKEQKLIIDTSKELLKQ